MADLTQLDAALTEAATKVASDYTPRSWIVFEHALAASQNVRDADPEPTQDLVDLSTAHLLFKMASLVSALGCQYPMDGDSHCTINRFGFSTFNNVLERDHRRVIFSATGLARKEAIVSPCSAAVSIDNDWDAVLQLLRFSPFGDDDNQPDPVVTVCIIDAVSNVVVLETRFSFPASAETNVPIIYNAALHEVTVGGDTFPVSDISSGGWRLFLGMEIFVDNRDATEYSATIVPIAPVTGNTLCDVMVTPLDEDSLPEPGEPLSPEWILPRVYELIDDYEEKMGVTNLVSAPFGVKMHLQLNYAISLALLHDNAAENTAAMDYVFEAIQDDEKGAFSQIATGRFDTLFLTMHPSAFTSFRAALKLIYQTLYPGALHPWLTNSTDDDMERLLGRTRAERLWWYLTRR